MLKTKRISITNNDFTWTVGCRTIFVNAGILGEKYWTIWIPLFDFISDHFSTLSRGTLCLWVWQSENFPLAIAIVPSPWWVFLPSSVARSWSVLSETNWRNDVPSGHIISSVLSCLTTFCLYRTTLNNKANYRITVSLLN